MTLGSKIPYPIRQASDPESLKGLKGRQGIALLQVKENLFALRHCFFSSANRMYQ
jgi:hypothetical protein